MPRVFRLAPRRRDHAGDQSGDGHRERLAGFREAGVNRISFGVQSFRDDELQRLARIHSADRAREAVREARAAGFDNVSLDLMMWLPGQTPRTGCETVEARSRCARHFRCIFSSSIPTRR